MVNPVEILKDGTHIQVFHNSTQEIKTNFDRDVIVFNTNLFEDYGLHANITAFSKAVQVDSLMASEYELTMFEMPNYTDTGVISTSGDPFIICYADEIAKVFGFQTVDELIADVRKRENLYENDEVKQYAQYTDLETLYKECDIITLHAPATEDNYHMIGTDAIAKMKQDVMIINCARGALIDTDALIDGIESGKVGFAGLDVVEHESGLYYFDRMGEPLHNPRLAILRSYSNVVVSPHTAFYTDEAVANMAENSIIGAIKFMNGEDTPYLV